MTPPPAPPQPLGQLLRRVADELHVLQRDGRALEDAIGRSILGEEPSTRETLENLQGIDLIVQTLNELGDYVGAMGEMVGDAAALDMSAPLARISLRDLARALSGGARRPIVDEAGRVTGEVDLF